MALVITRISVGNAQADRDLRHALEALGVPDGEEWTTSVVSPSAGGTWEVVLDGPPRRKDCHIDWEIVEREGGARYRKLFHNGERCVDKARHCLRSLIWESIQFRDNPLRSVSPKLADAFEEAVWGELREENMGPLVIRFGVWREGFDGMKFVCKVEYATVHAPLQPLPWSWWSSLVRTPDDLASELRRALAARRKRQLEAQAIIARTRRRAQRRRVPAPPLSAMVAHSASA